MPDRAGSGLVPLKSWFSLDIAAQLNEVETDEAPEEENPRATRSWPVLPRVWSTHRDVPSRAHSSDTDAPLQPERSGSTADDDLRELRYNGLLECP